MGREVALVVTDSHNQIGIWYENIALVGPETLRRFVDTAEKKFVRCFPWNTKVY